MKAFALSVLTAFLGLSGCFSVDQKKPQSGLETLNGEKYQAAGPAVKVSGIPISGPFVTRKNGTTVRGRVVADVAHGYHLRPLKFKKVVIKNGGTELIASTDENGKFQISGDIADGTWTVQLPGCEGGPKTFTVRGFEVDMGDWSVTCSATL